MPDHSTQSYLAGLNDVQLKAVTTTDGPVLVVAGPGSGKTRVLTHRVSHLIKSGVSPYNILALTFTNKAAREMKERISKVVGARANQVWAGTFHSIFARILRIEAEKIGYPSNFTIYDTEDTKNVLGNIIKEMQLDKNVYNANVVRSRISSAKSNLITPKLYADNEELRTQDRMAKRPHIHAVYAKYTARCKKAGAMDFDDLLYRLYELFQKNPEGVLDKYRQRFTYVLVDEFQDTNQLQYAIIRKLVNYEKSPRNVCVVGDDAQSIYAFRGATIQNILDFEEDFKSHGIKVFKLEQNYRSTEEIVQTANEVITYNRRQIPKKIWSDKGSGQRIKAIRALTDNEEGKRVVDTILEQKNRFHLSNSEIAILYRTNAQSRIFEEMLRRYNLSYRIFGGLSFYQRKEVKDIIAYMRLVVNPKDEEALRRIINFPKRGIGATTLDKIAQIAEANNQTLWEALPQVNVAARTKNSLSKFVKMINGLRKRLDKDNAHEVTHRIIEESGIGKLYKSDTSIEGMGRMENINSLLDGVKSFVDEEDPTLDIENLPDKSLATYLQNIALHTDLDNEQKNGDYITLMSVHSAKGLEFKSVFIVGLEEKLFPSFMSMDTVEGLDEERRLFYVAITRAEQFLTLSYANSRYRYGRMQYNEPSRFLEEVPGKFVDAGGMQSRNTKVEPPTIKGASVSGNFKRKALSNRVDPKNFSPSPSSDIQTGMKVLHLKFGEGKVLSIEGGAVNRVATIFFRELDNPQRRIMLKYAKLQILD
jgi:DNA helicase-2/ATP-dependent DNA helicase PcrA